MDHWPFDQPPDCAVISLRQIIFEGEPILYISHDEDDHGWQFLSGKNVVMSDAAIVALSEIVELDSTVLSVADLPPGWYAQRESVASAWKRARKIS